MGRRRKFGRALDGVLVLNKTGGMSSNHALQHAKRLFFANKAGHTGSLDPMATGVLPICFGESTKFSQYLLNADKHYRSTFRLGQATTTCDREGELTSSADAQHLTEAQLRSALSAFSGDIEQVPPMVSALKHQGKPLYELARRGIEIEREARPVTIHQLDVLAFRPGVIAEVDVAVHCTKGTYIRALADDLGRILEVGGHVSALHRIQAGPFSEADAVSLEQLETERGEGPAEVLDKHLLPVDAPVRALPKLVLDEHSSHYFCHGQPVMAIQVYRLGAQGDTLRVAGGDGRFLGLGEITDDGRVAPCRLVAFGQ